MKKEEKFFEGILSDTFTGSSDLYIGDIDFTFANTSSNIKFEIKTVSKDGTFTGKKISYNQAREYVALNGLKDNLGRYIKCYVVEYHKYAKRPYVIVAEFAKHLDDPMVRQHNRKMMYIDTQLPVWLASGCTMNIGVTPKKDLMCVDTADDGLPF